uniref:TPR_REGION domain-containing protein n=1 Tax=Steinernema glaseri TaxID=37863 RepID=A0A1I7YRC2_9BILA
MSNFPELDKLLEEGEGQQAYELAKKLLKEDKDNAELLWRLARACHYYASSLGKKDVAKKKELLTEGRDAGAAAYKINDKSFNVLKWAAVLSGEMSDFVGTKERIQEGYKFKEYLDKAIAINPDDNSLLHMRGRFSYSVANLSWLERKAAAAFFAEPPTATIDEALRDFEESERLKPNQWMENLYYLAKCYLAKGNKESAVKYLKIADGLEACDDGERDMQAEVRKLLEKNSK